MKISIPFDLYQKCHECSQNRWSNKKKGQFGRGLINNVDDPCKAERIGLLGEAALAQFINRKADYEYKEGGNPFDFQLNNLTIDIKTAAKNYGCGLIRAKTQNHTVIELKSNVYVFAYLEMENRTEQTAIVVMKGWLDKENIEKCDIVPARIGMHFNYQIKYEKLREIEELRKIRKDNFGKTES